MALTINSLVLLVMLASGLLGTAVRSDETSVAPDGTTTYTCGRERHSYTGCFNTWVQVTKNGKPGPWQPARCENGLCFQGGVAWWYWQGKEPIGSPVLTDFWVRDYAGPKNDNPYGDALKMEDKSCYTAKSTVFCMSAMQ